MSIFTPFEKEELCKICKNKGYHQMLVKPEEGIKGPDMTMMSFCACEVGKQLHQISKDFRREDLRMFAKPLLDSLRQLENKWKNRDEARGILRKIVLGTEKLLEEVERSESTKNDE